MSKIHFSVPIPKIIESIVLFFVLLYRKKHYGWTFRRIKVSNKFTIVDAEDYEKLVQYDWHYYETGNKNYYAVRFKGCKIVSMHRTIMNDPAGLVVDHINCNGLDNRKANLRITTKSQNHYNRRKTIRKTTSKYKGVHRITDRKAYCAKIRFKGKTISLGYHKNEEEAARAYDAAAKKYFGEYARLNFG